MTKYEQVLETAKEKGIEVIENYDFNGARFKGLYCDGVIALSNELRTEQEKLSVLYEEIAHHDTSVGNILDLDNISCVKQEFQARKEAYRKAVSLVALTGVLLRRVNTITDIAEELGVTEKFLLEALSYYKSTYGLFTPVRNKYILYFEPLGILEMF